MGYFEELEYQFKGMKLTTDSLNNLNAAEFLILTKIINNLYQTDCKPNEQIHQLIEQKL
jgi:hypothetical protein